MNSVELVALESGGWSRPVSLEVADSGVTVLLGRNGAGKTTLLNTIAGLLPIKSGKLLLNGKDITHQDCLDRKSLGLCIAPEGRPVFGRLTVRKNLLLGAYGSESKSSILTRLDWVLTVFPDLVGKLNVQSASLSGGQQTMVVVARGLMGASRVLLLDDPTLGLDPGNVGKLVGALKSVVVDSGISLLVADQGGSMARAFPESVVLMTGGEITYSGTLDSENASYALKEIFG